MITFATPWNLTGLERTELAAIATAFVVNKTPLLKRDILHLHYNGLENETYTPKRSRRGLEGIAAVVLQANVSEVQARTAQVSAAAASPVNFALSSGRKLTLAKVSYSKVAVAEKTTAAPQKVRLNDAFFHSCA